MLSQINGLHHVTSLASGAQQNNAFFTRVLGLRRVKKTVNFDRPQVYHLYYGDAVGSPGTVMTYFPFPDKPQGRRGTGEVGTTQFAIPEGGLGFWQQRLADGGVADLRTGTLFGAPSLHFSGPDGDDLALVEQPGDTRAPWSSAEISFDYAIRGFHGASFRLQDDGASAELLRQMGYEESDRASGTVRYTLPDGNGANQIDLDVIPNADRARSGSGSVHHIAFSVDDRAAQLAVRKELVEAGYEVTPVIDRNYFWAIYFRTPGGVLFEVATNEPGFDHDEDTAHLGSALKLPAQHAHLRDALESSLEPIDDA